MGPKVGLRASGQPWAMGRNPVGIGGGRRERRTVSRNVTQDAVVWFWNEEDGRMLVECWGGDKAGTALLRWLPLGRGGFWH